MNIWHKVNKDRIKPDSFLACIEISKGSKNKYELDKESGALILDRILYTSTQYPHNYGFIPLSYSGDNDPLDVLLLCTEPIVPLSLVEAYPIGVLLMTDNGEVDEKIIAVVKHDPFYNSFKDINTLPEHTLSEIKHFFEVYKALEGKTTVVDVFKGPDYAKKIIKEALDRYQNEIANNK